MVGHPVVNYVVLLFYAIIIPSKENIMSVLLTATLNDDGSVTIAPSPDYFSLDYEIAVGFISEVQLELDDTMLALDYANLLI